MTFSPPITAAEIAEAFRDRYISVTPISSGGQGVVFKAEPIGSAPPDPINALPYVALKVYYPNQVEERTDREVQALQSLNCRNIVRLHKSGKQLLRGQELVFVATEFVEGEVLSDRISSGPLQLSQIYRIGKDIANAVNHLWAERIVHRDIKPENIMLETSGESVLIDLGIARHLSLATLTAAGATWGTLGYMAPEHARARKQLSCKADIFSLGIVIQTCILGRHPTAGRQELLAQGGLPSSMLGPGLPASFRDFLDRMVHKEPQSRPSPSEVHAVFEALLTV